MSKITRRGRASIASSRPDQPSELMPAPARGLLFDALALLAMALAVLWMYCPAELLTSGGTKILSGGDFVTLHLRRIDFAQQALFSDHPHLPAWYPRELCGTPFWSNLQNFPLLPTRLAVIALFDSWQVHTIALNLAAVLAATFTYLFCRQMGIGRVGAATAGWTFAAAGYFASRLMVGHLPLLEAYPALPLLLWLAERFAGSASIRAMRVNACTLGLAAGIVMLAGHPQLPIYAVAATTIYLAVRAFGRTFIVGTAAMVAGVACAAFALWPMALLIRRSTRILPLARADNDIAMPLWRLKAFVLPWADGWPDSVVGRGAHVPFAGADNVVFWDTVCYVGVLPLVAVAVLVVRALWMRRMPARQWLVLTAIGALALLWSLSPVQSALPSGPWTILRSPARLLYLTTFSLAVAAGVAVHLLMRWQLRRRALVVAALVALLLIHAIDVRTHAVSFVDVVPNPGLAAATSGAIQLPDDGRLAMDLKIIHPSNRRLDDVGVFDSILLAKPYQAMTALAGWPADINQQYIDGAALGPRALAWAGARAAVTQEHRLDGLPLVGGNGQLRAYGVPGALPRAGLVPIRDIRYMDEDGIRAAMRAGAKPDASVAYLSPPAPVLPQTEPATTKPLAEVKYVRVSDDEITVDVHSDEPGVVRVLESWDPGWHATVDDHPVDVLLVDAFVMGVRVEPGDHVVRLAYATPGVGVGFAISLAGAASLALVTLIAGRRTASKPASA